MLNEILLPHTHRSQRNNADDPLTPQVEAYTTCNVTSLSVFLSCKGVEISPMEIFKLVNSPPYVEYAKKVRAKAYIHNKKLGMVWSILEKAANELLKGTYTAEFHTNWLQLSDIIEKLEAGSPVMVGGLFTHGGHVVCIVGYNSAGFIVADPWGNWTTGYENHDGDNVIYEYHKIVGVLHGHAGRFRALALKK